MDTKNSNPFSLTKANDLSDDDINKLWVDISGARTILDLARPASPMPMFILGGKGSGKTHLLRYCSYAVFKLRCQQNNISIPDAVRQSGYIGIYLRGNSLNANRFAGKGISDEAWQVLFSFYVELWIAYAALSTARDFLSYLDVDAETERHITQKIADEFDAHPPAGVTLSAMQAGIREVQKGIDFAISNAAFSRSINIDVTLTRGRLINGIPRILNEHIPALRDILFVYQIDEIEDLSFDQQKHINTLIREKEFPATFKIGARQYGIKTRETFSDAEVNLKDSEFEELRLDAQFRSNKNGYRQLARLLAARRLQAAAGTELASAEAIQIAKDLECWFEEVDTDWKSPYFLSLIKDAASRNRHHVITLRGKIEEGIAEGLSPGVTHDAHVDLICENIFCAEYPLLEKLNILLLYQNWYRGKNLVECAGTIRTQCTNFILNPKSERRYSQALSHYKYDLIAQLLKENKQKQNYLGIDMFIGMSEGLPRAFITLLKEVFDWSIFRVEDPLVRGKVSIEAQQKGALKGADWFYNSMRQAGEDGDLIKGVTQRICQLFRANRFSDKPIECSLVGFSADDSQASEIARSVLKKAQDRSFLVEIAGGQRDRNSDNVQIKLQVNRMLSPTWELPTARRGIVPLKPEEVNIIFDLSKKKEFDDLLKSWEAKMTAPAFGRARKQKKSLKKKKTNTSQATLF